jgi:hypothetical protein
METRWSYSSVRHATTIDRADVARGEPLHVPGLVADWPAIARWCPDYLRARAGDSSFVVETYPEGTPYGRVDMRRVPLSEFLTMLAAAGPERAPYLAETNRSLEKNAPGLASDFTVPAVLATQPSRTAALFLGRGSTTHLHFHHVDDALLCQVIGEKRVVLFAPRETRNLHPYPVHSPRWMWSRVDVESPDAKLHPRIADAHALECTLRPGDALFIPLHWWHAALSPGESGSVTWFWPSRRRLAHPLMAMRASTALFLTRQRARLRRFRTIR